jgi:hypothetical protein
MPACANERRIGAVRQLNAGCKLADTSRRAAPGPEADGHKICNRRPRPPKARDTAWQKWMVQAARLRAEYEAVGCGMV